MTSLDAVGLGALNLDIIYQVEKILIDGETIVKERRQAGGGSAANTVYGLARLGLSCGMVGAIGDDSEGNDLIRELAIAGVDISGIAMKRGTPTGEALCLSDAQSNRSIYVSPGANSKLTRADIPLSLISSARLVHISSFVDPVQKQVTRAVVKALPAEVILSFSPGSIYAREGMNSIQELISRTNILFLNREELQTLTGSDIPDGAKVLAEMGCGTVVVTLGGGDSPVAAYVRDGDKAFMVAAPRPRGFTPVDSTGAGDAFAAGYIWGHLSGKEPGVCGSLGHTMAVFALSGVGARANLPDITKLTDMYASLYGAGL